GRGERVVPGQHAPGPGVGAAEGDHALVAGGGVVELVQRRDREVEGRPRRGAGRRGDGEVGGGPRRVGQVEVHFHAGRGQACRHGVTARLRVGRDRRGRDAVAVREHGDAGPAAAEGTARAAGRSVEGDGEAANCIVIRVLQRD